MASTKYPKYNVKLQPICERKRRKSDLVIMWQSIVDVAWRIFLTIHLTFLEIWQHARLMIWQDEIHDIKQFLKKYLTEVPQDFSNSWRDGRSLCMLLNNLKPGCIPDAEKLDRNYGLRNMYRAFDTLETKFGIIPTVTAEQLVVCVDGSHLKLLDILSQLKREAENKKAIPKINVESFETVHEKQETESSSDNCIVKGTGLMIAFVERRANFIIFCSTASDINLVIEIKGPRNTVCRERITKRSPKKKLSTTQIDEIKFRSLSRSTSYSDRSISKADLDKLTDTDEKLIPLEYKIHLNQISLTYIPLAEGQHVISVLWHGKHVSESPYVVIVESTVDSSINALKQIKCTLALPDNNEDHGNKERRKAVVEHQECAKNITRVGKVINRKVLRHIVKIKDKDIVVDSSDIDHIASALLKMDYEIQADPTKGRRNSWGFTGDAERKISAIRQFCIPPQEMEAQFLKLQGRSRSLTTNSNSVSSLRRSASFEGEDLLQQTKLETVSEDMTNGGGHNTWASIEDDEEVFAYLDRKILSTKEYFEEAENGISQPSTGVSERLEEHPDECSFQCTENGSIHKGKVVNNDFANESTLKSLKKENIGNKQTYKFSRIDSCNTEESFYENVLDNNSEYIIDNILNSENQNESPNDILITSSIGSIGQAIERNLMNDSENILSKDELKRPNRKSEVLKINRNNLHFDKYGLIEKNDIVTLCNNFSEQDISENSKSNESFSDSTACFPNVQENLDNFCKKSLSKQSLNKIELKSNTGPFYPMEKLKNNRKNSPKYRRSRNNSHSKVRKNQWYYIDCVNSSKFSTSRRKYILRKKSKHECKHTCGKTARSESFPFTKNLNIVDFISSSNNTMNINGSITNVSKRNMTSIHQVSYGKKYSDVKVPLCNIGKKYVHESKTSLDSINEEKKYIFEPILSNMDLFNNMTKLINNENQNTLTPVTNQKVEKSSEDSVENRTIAAEYSKNTFVLSSQPKSDQDMLQNKSSNFNQMSCYMKSEIDNNSIQKNDSKSLEQYNYKQFNPYKENYRGSLIKNKIKILQENIKRNSEKVTFNLNSRSSVSNIRGDVKAKKTFWENVYRQDDQTCPPVTQRENEYIKETDTFQKVNQLSIYNEDIFEDTTDILKRGTTDEEFFLPFDSSDVFRNRGVSSNTSVNKSHVVSNNNITSSFKSIPRLKYSFSDPNILSTEVQNQILTIQRPLEKPTTFRDLQSIDNLSSSVDTDLLESSIDDGLYSADALMSTEDEYIDDEIPDNALLTHWGDLSLMDSLRVGNEYENKDFYQNVDTELLKNQYHSAKFYPSECKVYGIGTYYGYVAVKNRFKVLTKGAGDGNLSASVQGFGKHDVSLVSVKYLQKDIYEVIYQVQRPGLYLIFLRWMENPIVGSPFLCKVTF